LDEEQVRSVTVLLVDETNIAFSDMSSAHGTAWHTAMTPRDPR